MRSFTCPACGSDRIQKARILSRAGIPINNEAARILSPPVEPTSPIEPAGRFSVYIGTSLLIISVYILVTLHTAHTDRIGLFLQTMGGDSRSSWSFTLGFIPNTTERKKA